MFKRDIKVYGGTGEAAAAATPDDIDQIGRPSIHLISGATGVGKSNVARNLVEAYDDAHRRARNRLPPDILVFTGAGGDPVWAGMNPKRVKMYTPKEEGAFVDEINLRYDRAMRAKGGKSAEGGAAEIPSSERFVPRGAAASAAEKMAGAGKDEDKHRATMVVIDDAAASGLIPLQMARSPIAQALQSHRHADMSFVVSSQRYHGHNPWLRANAATVNVFPPKGAEELNFLKRDLPVPHTAMQRGFAVAAAKGVHSFVHVDMRNRVATHDFTGQTI